METDEASGDPEVAKQISRPAGVFGRHDGHLAQHPQCPCRDVVQVADRRGNDKQRTSHILL
jgi:hypothetical protein